MHHHYSRHGRPVLRTTRGPACRRSPPARDHGEVGSTGAMATGARARTLRPSGPHSEETSRPPSCPRGHPSPGCCSASFAALALIAGAAPVAQGAPACADQALPCNLTDGLDDAQSLNPLAVAPDGRRVVFTHRDLNPPSELFSADIHGAERPIRLSPENEEASFVAISPDARRVLYMRSMPGGQDSIACLSPAPLPAGVRLTGNLGPQPQVAVSPDGGKVVYAPPAANELRVVPVTGGQSRRLTDPFVPGRRAGSIRISADGDSVVY